MQIVIDIDDRVYGLLKYFEESMELNDKKDNSDDVKTALMRAVINGTPLPKGHGRLIDVGQCNRKLFYQQCGGADSLITVKSAFDMLLSLPTIIEADKDKENKE